MGTYTVILDEQQDIALQYALELALQHGASPPEEGVEPPPPPTLETMPQVIVTADLLNRQRDLASLAVQTLMVLESVITAETREAILLAARVPGSPVASQTLQRYLRFVLAQRGA